MPKFEIVADSDNKRFVCKMDGENLFADEILVGMSKHHISEDETERIAHISWTKKVGDVGVSSWITYDINGVESGETTDPAFAEMSIAKRIEFAKSQKK
jgi:hypothetical protein